MKTASQTLKEKGLVATPQRIAIYRALAATKSHPSVEELHEMVKQSFPTMSLNTVYTTVCALVAAGLARRIEVGGSTRYDANVLSHAHFTCTKCHKVDDLPESIDKATEHL